MKLLFKKKKSNQLSRFFTLRIQKVTVSPSRKEEKKIKKERFYWRSIRR